MASAPVSGVRVHLSVTQRRSDRIPQPPSAVASAPLLLLHCSKPYRFILILVGEGLEEVREFISRFLPGVIDSNAIASDNCVDGVIQGLACLWILIEEMM